MGTPFLEAAPFQCRRPLWPLSQRIGDVCGAPAKPGSSYCPACHALMYDRLGAAREHHEKWRARTVKRSPGWRRTMAVE